MGLLSRASTLDETEKLPELAFSDFIIKHSLKICALLDQNASNYVVINSVGFDARSIMSATSTIDFWNGICKEAGKCYYFEGTDKSPFFQLFSLNLKDCIRTVSVYQNSRSQILICEGKLTDAAAKDFEYVNCEPHSNKIPALNPLIKKNTVVLLLKFDFSEAVQNFLSAENQRLELTEVFSNALMSEVYNRFTCVYNLPDATVKAGTTGIKTIFVSGKAYSIELIKNHIILNLKEVFEDSAEFIKIDFFGTADSCEKVNSFLQAE